VPDSAARSLVSRQALAIGLRAPPPGDAAFADPAFTRFAGGAMRLCAQHGYALQLIPAWGDAPYCAVDGWLAFGSPAPLSPGQTRGLPVMHVEPAFDPHEPAALTLRADHYQAALILGCHLRASARRIAYFTRSGAEGAAPHRLRRFEVFRRSVEGISEVRAMPLGGILPGETRLRREVRLLHDEDRVDTLVAEDDELGALLIKAALSAGLHVPRDLPLAALANIGYARLCHPTLTTIDLRLGDLGERAAAALFAHLTRGTRKTALRPPRPPAPVLIPGGSTQT